MYKTYCLLAFCSGLFLSLPVYSQNARISQEALAQLKNDPSFSWLPDDLFEKAANQVASKHFKTGVLLEAKDVSSGREYWIANIEAVLFENLVKQVAPKYFKDIPLEVYPDFIAASILYHIDENSRKLLTGKHVNFDYVKDKAIRAIELIGNKNDLRPHMESGKNYELACWIEKALIKYVTENRREEINTPIARCNYLPDEVTDEEWVACINDRSNH